MNAPLRVLIVEDSADDVLLMAQQLKRAGLDVVYRHIDSADEMNAALVTGDWDAVLADYSMPHFGALPALELIKQRELDLPFIIVSGSIGEDAAVAAMKAGAHDYIMKDKMMRLAPVIEREIRDAQVRHARHAAEAQIRRQLERLSALRTIDSAINASLDLRVTLDILLSQVTLQLRVDAADVLLLKPYLQTLETAAVRGFRSGSIMHSVLRLGNSYGGRVALERRTLHIPDLTTLDNPTISNWLQGEGFVTYYGVPLIAKGQVKGVLEILHRAPLESSNEWLDFLETIAGQAAIAIDNATLFENLQHSNLELALAYDTTLEGWSRALDLRDKETEGHTVRVVDMILNLARAFGIVAPELTHIRRGALLHDIGKMGIPDNILLKPGPLTSAEWEIMRRHPSYAYNLLEPIMYLRPALDIPYCHHEKWDGTGYPRGLRGEQIPFAARLFAVVDVWDALRSDRPYRAAWGQAQARAYLHAQSGTLFDPQVLAAFERMLAEDEAS